jgi:hypothetical protein
MRSEPLYRLQLRWTCGLAAVFSATLACAPVSDPVKIPPAPIAYNWPDPAFLPEIQCRGAYAVEELAGYLPRARLAMWLPGTRTVSLDRGRRCLTVTVDAVGDGRLAELLLRGVAVPRRAVLLLLAPPVKATPRG